MPSLFIRYGRQVVSQAQPQADISHDALFPLPSSRLQSVADAGSSVVVSGVSVEPSQFTLRINA